MYPILWKAECDGVTGPCTRAGAGERRGAALLRARAAPRRPRLLRPVRPIGPRLGRPSISTRRPTGPCWGASPPSARWSDAAGRRPSSTRGSAASSVRIGVTALAACVRAASAAHCSSGPWAPPPPSPPIRRALEPDHLRRRCLRLRRLRWRLRRRLRRRLHRLLRRRLRRRSSPSRRLRSARLRRARFRRRPRRALRRCRSAERHSTVAAAAETVAAGSLRRALRRRASRRASSASCGAMSHVPCAWLRRARSSLG